MSAARARGDAGTMQQTPATSHLTMVRKLVVAVVAVAAFLITPYFLFKQGDEDFQFGAPEMRAAVEGTWRIELSSRQGPSRSITFTIEQAGSPPNAARERRWIRTAEACSHRTLVRSAEACLDTTEMELRSIALDGDRSLFPTATLRVHGMTFERGLLDLQLDGNILRVIISRTGAVLEVLTHGSDHTVSLARLEGAPAGR
jgi:hypothetical protein